MPTRDCSDREPVDLVEKSEAVGLSPSEWLSIVSTRHAVVAPWEPEEWRDAVLSTFEGQSKRAEGDEDSARDT